jgi:hypothetical protein
VGVYRSKVIEAVKTNLYLYRSKDSARRKSQRWRERESRDDDRSDLSLTPRMFRASRGHAVIIYRSIDGHDDDDFSRALIVN